MEVDNSDNITYNKIFKFPKATIIDKKMPKTVFTKHFQLSASEKKLLLLINSINVVATIKPSNSNINGKNTSEYDYPEIHLMKCVLPPNSLKDNFERSATLIQKHLPLQIVLIIEDNNEFVINVCDKRINQVDKNKRTIEKQYTTEVLSKLYKNEVTSGFFKSLSFSELEKTDMQTTYNSYIKAIVNLKTANIIGSFKVRTKARTAEDMKLLALIEGKEKEIVSLKSKMKKEKQFNNKMNINAP